MFTDSFDATNIKPQQGFDTHPPGMFDAQVSNTYAKATSSGNGGMLCVEFTTPAGRIENRYNLWNASPQAVEIAQKELSALCHATGVYKLTFPKDQGGMPIVDQAARELRGARCKIEVAPQTDKEGKPHPQGYVEVKKVYDPQGNEPGKPQAAPQTTAPNNQGGGWNAPNNPPAQPPQGQAPMQQNAQGGWGPPPNQQQQPQQNSGWNQQPQNNQPQGNTPPWGAR